MTKISQFAHDYYLLIEFKEWDLIRNPYPILL